MTAAVTIRGTFADFKLVKTRSVAQMIIEVPIERGAQIIEAFGLPQAGAEIWVAVVRMKAPHQAPKDWAEKAAVEAGSSKGRTADFESADAGSSPAPAAKRDWHELSRAAQAGIRCDDQRFQIWVRQRGGQEMMVYEPVTIVRKLCGVDSRAFLDTNEEAGKLWDALDTEYLQAMGRMAEDR